MVKKDKKEIKITDKVLNDIQPLKGKVFKEFMKMGTDLEEDTSDQIFRVFVKESLDSAGVQVEDPYEDLTLGEFSEVLAKVMEINNMEELFQTIERLSRFAPK